MRFDSEPNESWLAGLADRLAHGNTEWVALLPRELLEHASVRRIIAERFFDYHTLPLDGVTRLLTTLGHAHGMATLKRGECECAEGAASGHLVGHSPGMMAVLRTIPRIAQTGAAVLVTGESGTGKELVARSIHERSGRKGGPFVAINCGAIPANLIQSELFGHERGAFTGASQRRIGRIEAAQGGTLFLDEVGDLPIELQANLLRFLQEKQIDRVGGQQPVDVDVRVIAATHVDLAQAVATACFRQDLFHRLNVLHLHMPALREREGDIEVLAKHFFRLQAHEGRRSLRGFSRSAMEALRSYDWPGNVRELINRVRRAIVMSEGRLIGPVDLGLPHLPVVHRSLLTLEAAREHAERDAVERALRHYPGNIAQAARGLGISRVTLYRLIAKHGLQGSGRLLPVGGVA